MQTYSPALANDINTKHNEHARASTELERKKAALDNLTQQVSVLA